MNSLQWSSHFRKCLRRGRLLHSFIGHSLTHLARLDPLIDVSLHRRPRVTLFDLSYDFIAAEMAAELRVVGLLEDSVTGADRAVDAEWRLARAGSRHACFCPWRINEENPINTSEFVGKLSQSRIEFRCFVGELVERFTDRIEVGVFLLQTPDEIFARGDSRDGRVVQ